MKTTRSFSLAAFIATLMLLLLSSCGTVGDGSDNNSNNSQQDAEPSSSSVVQPPPPLPSSSSFNITPSSNSTPRCGNVEYNTSTQFCSGNTVYAKCGGNEYNPSTYFCSGNTIVAKCGGSEYNPSTQFCSGSTAYTKCGGNEYNPSTHFCSGSTVVVKCGGKEYNPAMQECTNNVVFSFLTDSRDSKRYKTVDIGTQTWMAENLNYNVSGSKCPNNNTSNCTIYGRQYNWLTATTVCPTGWHLPSFSEWLVLAAFIGGDNQGQKLKAKSGWNNNGNGTDDYGFAALPGGYVCYNCDSFLLIPVDTYPDIGDAGYWWTDTEAGSLAYYMIMYKDSRTLMYDSWDRSDMNSIRCLKN